LSNDYKDFEIIVVDDGSSDNTREEASRYPVILESTGGRKGPSAARNIGARRAKGDVLLFLDSDVVAPSHLLGHVVKRFETEPELKAIVGYYDKKPLNTGLFPRYKALLAHYWFKDAKIMESFETCCGAIRKSVFDEAGGFDEKYADADVEDYEFGYRISKKGFIGVDHRMVVGHHFPSFGKNFMNYIRRAKLWMRIFIKRRKFESTATTSGEGLTRVAGVGSIVFLLGGLFFRPFFVLGLVLFMFYVFKVSGFIRLVFREEVAFFAAFAFMTHLVNSFAVAIGVAMALSGYLFSGIESKDG